MSLFGSDSKTFTTTSQSGAEGGSNVATSGGSIVNEFPEEVSTFATGTLGLAESALNAIADTAKQSLSASRAVTTGAADAFATLAEREKTPLTSFLPFAAIFAVAAVIISRNW